ncbi:hypothetical protein GF377_01755 [candidate division GN15 bacterium]|nr:hypothetical protein [candidate division GN15 bacterium]
MNWRYQTAQRLAFITLIISVVMMILLPWSREQKEPDYEPEEYLDEEDE